VDLVIDPVWGEPAVAALRAAAPGARLVQIGAMAAEAVQLPAAILRANNVASWATPCSTPRSTSGGAPTDS
jgi:NADPH:quinone reductase-like Zn-dependent oxidoreductase